MPDDEKLPVYELAFNEGFRAVGDQVRSLEHIRVVAATLLGISTAASGILAGVVINAPSSERDAWLYLGLGIGAVLYVWLLGSWANVLRMNLEWRHNLSPKVIVNEYADHSTPATIGETHRQLALYVQENVDHNETQLKKLRQRFNHALTLFIVEVVWWSMVALLVTMAGTTTRDREPLPTRTVQHVRMTLAPGNGYALSTQPGAQGA